MDDAQPAEVATPTPVIEPGSGAGHSPAAELLASVRELLLRYLDEPRTVVDVAKAFDVQKHQADRWLTRLVVEGAIERLKPSRYRTIDADAKPLFTAFGSGEH